MFADRSGPISRRPGRGIAAGLAGLLLAGISASAASASETRGYVVSWFYMSAASEEGDCPGGPNPNADVNFRRILNEMGKSPEEIEKLLAKFPDTMYYNAPMRAKVDGKPVNVYTHPTAAPDPHIKTVEGKYGYGFNLDGKGAASPNSFEDPETHEKGINNQLYRALGCIPSERGNATSRPSYPSIQWDTVRDSSPAWLIEISGIDDPKNDDDVTVAFYRATGPITRNASGDPQVDMTFTVDPNPRSGAVVHGKIKDGVLVTNKFDLDMLNDPFAMPEYHFKEARLRLNFRPDGSIQGILGGYHAWRPIYVSLALGGSVNEANLSFDLPGMYYAMKKFADAYPDPKTGENTAISTGYWVEAVPAFIVHPAEAKTSDASGKTQAVRVTEAR